MWKVRIQIYLTSLALQLNVQCIIFMFFRFHQFPLIRFSALAPTAVQGIVMPTYTLIGVDKFNDVIFIWRVDAAWVEFVIFRDW
jgi:hypothetical protein